MIDILIPVLGRPHNAAPLVQNIHDTTAEPVTVTFLCSRGDNDQIKACLASGAHHIEIMEFAAGHADYAKKINHGLNVTGSEWVFNAADDLRFEPGWDKAALVVAGSRYDVVGTNDLANGAVKQGRFGTHCLIRRRYVTGQGAVVDASPGTVLSEAYDHNFVDRELCHTAQHRRLYAAAKHSRVKHYHYLWKTAPKDQTYRKAMRNYQNDYRLFCARAHLWGNVGLSATERKAAA